MVINFQVYFTQKTGINLGYVNFSSVPYKKVMLHQGIYPNYFHSIYIFTLQAWTNLKLW